MWLESRAEESQTVAAYPVEGGPPQTICSGCGTGPANLGPPVVGWSQDQSTIYIGYQMRTMKKKPGILAVPLPRGLALPPFFSSGPVSGDEIAAKPGARMLDDAVFPGAGASRYMSTRVTAHRNIYRLELP